ncbi:hypothetical protein CCR75_006251 [Bremia lactucae]|uniref:Conserved oligomeric Golgi complex subunit 3 C-terminal domain-containing protein n=1 Tax=Bremia lactucae TaxID=4779 RepID=A0A976FNN0_BRELC|nr:hypothetical protein CCR75_006251 [Bremia lactucae]
MAPHGVLETRLTSKQDALLHSLERRVQLKIQAEAHAPLYSERHPNAPETLRDFIARRPSSIPSASFKFDPSFIHVSSKIDQCMSQWNAVYAHAHASQALVAEMEASHAQVVTKTQALYQSFEEILQQVDALDTRVASIAAPMPYFTAIDTVAHTLGFGVKYAAPSSESKQHVLMKNTSTLRKFSTVALDTNKAVQVYQHRRGLDPTTPAFEQALKTIDHSVAYLMQHLEYKDSACFIEAYKTLAIGGIQELKDYALSGLEAAKDAVNEVIQKEAISHQPRDRLTSLQSQLEETSPCYVNFLLVTPALAAVAKQLERLQTPTLQDRFENIRLLGEVIDAYTTQRMHLLAPILGAWLDTVSQTSDLVNGLRMGCTQLLKVCEAEFRLFQKLFHHDPSDEMFQFPAVNGSFDENDQEENDTAFESVIYSYVGYISIYRDSRFIFQLSGLLYNTMRPQFLAQKDMEILCEGIQVLRSEVIEGLITPRIALVGYTEPVMLRMIQDAQERLILCMQKYIRDEIEGFVPSPSDLDYPTKLKAAENVNAPLYATWYPSLEHTLMCLSKGYHYVKVEIFEELAQDAIQICAASLVMASADITANHGELHGSLFLVKHLLTLREQITPFEIQFAQRSKSLDFTSSADALNELLVDASTLFRFSGLNGIVNLVSRGMPQIQETTADVKKALEQELRKSCTHFIEFVLQQLAQPLLDLLKQIAHEQQMQHATALDFRQCAFTAPNEVYDVLASLSRQLGDVQLRIRETVHLYLRNASTEMILLKPVQQNLLDAVRNVSALMKRTYTCEELQSCQEITAIVLQQLDAF